MMDTTHPDGYKEPPPIVFWSELLKQLQNIGDNQMRLAERVRGIEVQTTEIVDEQKLLIQSMKDMQLQYSRIQRLEDKWDVMENNIKQRATVVERRLKWWQSVAVVVISVTLTALVEWLVRFQIVPK